MDEAATTLSKDEAKQERIAMRAKRIQVQLQPSGDIRRRAAYATTLARNAPWSDRRERRTSWKRSKNRRRETVWPH